MRAARPLNGGQPYPSAEHLRYGFTARHVRCDCCLRDYLPQHVDRKGRRGWWICGNCEPGSTPGPPRRYAVPRGRGVEPACRTRHRYRRSRHWGVKRALGLLGADFKYIWFWRKRLGDRKGQPLRVICRGAMNSALVEFEDGYRAVVSRNGIRKAAWAT